MDFRGFTGLRDDRPIERFDATDLSVAQNVDIDNSGGVAMRLGYALRSAGGKHSLWSDPSGTLGFYVSGSTLYGINSDLSGSLLVSGLTANSPMSYVRAVDRVYFTNAYQTGVVEAGVARSWGIGIPPTIRVTATVGLMPAGTYQFTTTYFRKDGQESGAGLAGTITLLAGSGLSFSLNPSTDPGVTSIGVYLSAPNSEVMYLAMVAANAAATVTYANDTLELNLPLATQFLSPPPAGQLVAYYRGRMFVAVGDVIYPSEPFSYELFDLRKYIQLDSRVTMLAVIEDDQETESGMFVGTDRSMGSMVGQDSFSYIPKANYGAIEGALDYVDGALFGDDSAGVRELPMWLTTQGLCVGMPDMSIRNLTRTRYTIPASGRGACLFQPGRNVFVASSYYPAVYGTMSASLLPITVAGAG